MKRLYALALLSFAASVQSQGIPVTGGALHAATLQAAMQAADSLPKVQNEAVRVLPGGKRIVEEPPGPKSLHKLPTRPSHWAAGPTLAYVIDSNSGLKECGWPWLSEGCRDYRPGADRRERAWVIKSAGQWLKCPHRDNLAGCVDYYAPTPQMPTQP